MRRHDRELTERGELEAILRTADVCRLAFSTGGAPYIVPMNFGYRWEERLVLFFHCASEGRKLELMKANPSVGFELDVDHRLVTASDACHWGMDYGSIIGTGRLSLVEGDENRRAALDAIMAQYGFEGTPAYAAAKYARTVVLRLDVEEFSGKRRK
jgi:nitroimidazol reductase NimA-like FMN-containing flavoprotein (pyridoxamine 5'-phosphate oxidase superfamily)